MNALVGYTGFVGSNIDRAAHFDLKYNSKNIKEAFGTRPDLLVYSGVKAEKYLANQQPEQDLAGIKEAFENIQKIEPRHLVLISTADVYKVPVGVNENTPVETEGLHAYGLNRYYLEQWVREAFEGASIVRLPALFGPGIKKNFIYDFIHRIPFMLTEAKFQELAGKDDFLLPYYTRLDNGFYQCRALDETERRALKRYFENIGFSALQFTDSRSRFQFYPLERLWGDLQTILKKEIPLINIVTEPLSASEVHEYITGRPFDNVLGKPAADYDIQTIYADVFGAQGAYMMNRQDVLSQLKAFVLSND